MLNGDGNENGIKINRSHQQKNKFARAAHFFSNLPLFCTTTMPFCTTKTSNFLHIIFMNELSYVLTKDFVSCVHVRFYFFSAAHFSLAFLVFSPPL